MAQKVSKNGSAAAEFEFSAHTLFRMQSVPFALIYRQLARLVVKVLRGVKPEESQITSASCIT